MLITAVYQKVTNRYQFVTSRPNSPLLLKSRHGPSISQDLDLNGSPSSRTNGGLAIPKANGTPKSGPDAVSVLEAKANGM